MSYKIKSLIYFAAFIVSAVIYDAATLDEVSEVAHNEGIEKAISDNIQMDVPGESELLKEATLKN